MKITFKSFISSLSIALMPMFIFSSLAVCKPANLFNSQNTLCCCTGSVSSSNIETCCGCEIKDAEKQMEMILNLTENGHKNFYTFIKFIFNLDNQNISDDKINPVFSCTHSPRKVNIYIINSNFRI